MLFILVQAIVSSVGNIEPFFDSTSVRLFYIYMESLDSPLLNDMLLAFHLLSFHSEIIGLRKMPLPDIIR
jgi:hypothetical protein